MKRTEQESMTAADGELTLTDELLEQIAGKAAREVDGVHDVGGKGSRGRFRLRTARAVTAAHGKTQAAFDLGIVVRYGANIPQVAEEVRERVRVRIREMTELETVEVNVSVRDVYVGPEPPGGRSLE